MVDQSARKSGVPMINEVLHNKILGKMDQLCEWYAGQIKDKNIPFYSSYDIRDASFKMTNVDANIYPAGFNNICPTDKDYTPRLMKLYVDKHYPKTKNILLVTEDNLKNAYYWENVNAIKNFLGEAGYNIRVGMPGLQDQESMELESYLGNKVTVEKVLSVDGKLKLAGFEPDLVISNNDFTKLYEKWGDISSTAMTPSMDLGWFQRKKSVYFDHFNQVATEFAKILEVDPWLFTVKTEIFTDFDVTSEESRRHLSEKAQKVLESIAADYKKHDIQESPFLFIKNNSGTYGLGVTQVTNAEEVINWSYDAKKKMKAQKGGGRFSEVIIQEGVPTVIKSGGAVAEPTIYMVGDHLAGGFLRTHEQKDERESLNSPGAVYKKLCLSDLTIKAEGCPLENVYGWVAKMGLLAISRETQAMNAKYKGYIK
jgi:glutamate--cysteine ligase